MYKEILEALKTKFQGVSDTILGRIATKLAKTVNDADKVQDAVDGVTVQQLLESYGDSRATEAQETAVKNYEKKHGLKDGKAVSGGEPTQTTTTTQEPAQQNKTTEGDDTPAWAKTLIEQNKSLKERLDKLDGERTRQSRKTIIDKIIEPLTETQRKAYQRITLETLSDDDFAALQEEIKGEVEEIVKERGAQSSVFGRPAGGTKPNAAAPTDKELDELARKLNIKTNKKNA